MSNGVDTFSGGVWNRVWSVGHEIPPFPGSIVLILVLVFYSQMSSAEKEKVLNRPRNHLLSPSPPKTKVASLLSFNINVALSFFLFLCRGASLSQLQVCENFLWLQTAVVSRIRKNRLEFIIQLWWKISETMEPQACQNPAVLRVGKKGCSGQNIQRSC